LEPIQTPANDPGAQPNPDTINLADASLALSSKSGGITSPSVSAAFTGKSVFSAIEPGPRDGDVDFARDINPNKVDLRAGIYKDELGQATPMKVVSEVAASLDFSKQSMAYLPTEGHPLYRACVQEMLFGDSLDAVRDRLVTVQSVGGSNSLRLGAEFLNRHFPESQFFVSELSWPEHQRIFERAGIPVGTYPYYDKANRTLDFDRMLSTIAALPRHSIVMLQVSCHNPTGLDPTNQQWDALVNLFKKSELIPFLDLAYQGFGRGLDEDAYAIRRMANEGVPCLIASCVSKNFSLYNRRIGALSIITGSAEEASSVLSQLKTDIRACFSNPPADGALLVAGVLSDPERKERWKEELAEMRTRIQDTRELLVKSLEAAGAGAEFAHLRGQTGLFAHTDLSKEQVKRLQKEFGVYLLGNGRISLAAVNQSNADYIARAIASVIGH
jgi:aromatic-amino-acid transaminase